MYNLIARIFMAEKRSIDQVEKRAETIGAALGEDAREKFTTAIFAEAHTEIMEDLRNERRQKLTNAVASQFGMTVEEYQKLVGG